MNTEIKYNGYTANPSGYECPDGDLSISLGLIKNNGVLKQIKNPMIIGKVDKDSIFLAIHQIPNQDNYIYTRKVSENKYELFFKKDNTGDRIPILTLKEDITSVNTIGNSVIAISGNIPFYALWKNERYINLGSRIPELKATPYIKTIVEDTQSLYTKFGPNIEELSTSYLSGDGYIPTSEAQKLFNGTTTSIPLFGVSRKNVYDRLFAIINLFRNEMRKEGFFTEPFFIRYAYRMYDGTNTMQTPPSLVIPNSSGKPICTVDIQSNGDVQSFPLMPSSKLYTHFRLPDNIADWSDIITHIDIFVSSPMVDYTDNPESLASLSLIDGYIEGPQPSYDDSLCPFCGNYNERINLATYENIFTLKQNNSDGYDVSPCARRAGKNFMLNIYSERIYKSQYLIIDTSVGDVTLTIASSGKVMNPTTKIPFNPPYPIYKAYFLSRLLISPSDRVVIADRDFNGFYFRGPSKYSIKNPKFEIVLDRTDGKSIHDQIRDVSSFFHVSEILLDKNIPVDDTFLIDIDRNVLNQLETRRTLSDLGQSRKDIKTKDSFTYNNRLNIIVDEQSAPCSTSWTEQSPYESKKGEIAEKVIAAYVEITENSQTVFKQIETPLNSDYGTRYFSYPSANAKILHIFTKTFPDPEISYSKIILKRSDFLDMAYSYNDMDYLKSDFINANFGEPVIPKENNIRYGNKIITSEVNNPFVFSGAFSSLLPVGEIIALSSATHALSEGQFGQFPLYAFTDEGIWALSVSDTGVYNAVQPISRDVCNNKGSITQLDDSVLFTTDRGIILLQGSTTICISEILEGINYDIDNMPKIGDLLSMLGYINADVDIVPLRDFLVNCKMIYDYPHQRIIIYNTRQNYSLLYSLEDKSWGMQRNILSYNIASYPEAIAVDMDNNIVNISKDGEIQKGLLITRPLKLDYPNELKTISSIVQRGNFRKGNIKTALYGSRDLTHWFLVSSSVDHCLRGFSGTPYKYFRIAVLSTMKEDESLFGATISFSTKHTNKIR